LKALLREENKSASYAYSIEIPTADP
jgi:hypothetical protein